MDSRKVVRVLNEGDPLETQVLVEGLKVPEVISVKFQHGAGSLPEVRVELWCGGLDALGYLTHVEVKHISTCLSTGEAHRRMSVLVREMLPHLDVPDVDNILWGDVTLFHAALALVQSRMRF